ncbi:MAG: hypothetical protein CME71_12085 [Halobacteriovorax sp.]|nr:hypothetical protein [Halobacteriovorax sp.]
MKSKLDIESLRVLMILKLDAKGLFERIKEREREYVGVFAQKRTREHFPAVFKTRYDGTALSDLKKCSEDVIIGLDQFHRVVDEMRWYLMITEDMPATVTDKLESMIHEMEENYDMLMLLIDAELGISAKREEIQIVGEEDAGQL